VADDDPDWDDLRILRSALARGSLVGAARELGVQHTTVGRRLSALERRLGVSLVVRGPDGLAPTATAEALLPHLDEAARAIDAVVALARTRRRHVRLATPSGFAAYFTEALATLRAEHPEISLELVSGARPVDVKRGEADLALRVGPVADPDLVVRRVTESGWALYVGRRYLERVARPIDPLDLSGHDVVGYDDAFAGSPPATWLAEHLGTASVVLRSREMVDMRDAAVHGVGLAVLPCGLGDPHPELTRATPEVVARRPISVVHRRDAKLSAAVRIVLAMVVEVMAAHGDALSGRRH
jgi:DNA-binding transcriptional LysR family regulator